MLLLMGGDQCVSESDGFESDDSGEGGMAVAAHCVSESEFGGIVGVTGGAGVGRKTVTSHFMDGFEVVFGEDVACVAGAGVSGGVASDDVVGADVVDVSGALRVSGVAFVPWCCMKCLLAHAALSLLVSVVGFVRTLRFDFSGCDTRYRVLSCNQSTGAKLFFDFQNIPRGEEIPQ